MIITAGAAPDVICSMPTAMRRGMNLATGETIMQTIMAMMSSLVMVLVIGAVAMVFTTVTKMIHFGMNRASWHAALLVADPAEQRI